MVKTVTWNTFKKVVKMVAVLLFTSNSEAYWICRSMKKSDKMPKIFRKYWEVSEKIAALNMKVWNQIWIAV